jgi:NADH:ubiquinone oxidoreductase subunit 2 (subunit N)
LLLNLNPFIKIIYYFSCLCLAGLPFLRAFFSKDFMIEKIMESRLEFFFIIFLLFFLGIGVFYRIKLLNLIHPSYSYMIIEKRFMAIIRVLVIVFLMILIINLYISLVFSLSLEVFSNKIFIYIIILVFIILSIFTDFNYKIVRYEKIKNFKEI